MSTIFPSWTNKLPTLIAGGAVSAACLAVGVAWYYFTPKYWAVGYMPTQPGCGFIHQIHAGKLGMDCSYCHTKVEESAEANIPTVETCMGCHADGRLKVFNNQAHKDKTDFIRAAYAADESIEWRRIHKVPDYVRNFPHNAHIAAGVSCLSCHGNIARMPVVYQHEPLSMGWCLDCHRNPEPHLVAKDMVTKLFDIEKIPLDTRIEQGRKYYEERRLAAPEGCGACHY